MGVVKHAVRVVSEGGFAVPVRRQPPLVVGYEHFRLERQGALLSPKTTVFQLVSLVQLCHRSGQRSGNL